MASSQKRRLVRPLVLALFLMGAPLAFGSPAAPIIKVNDACAESGKCCYEIGSFCGESFDHYRTSGKCSPLL